MNIKKIINLILISLIIVDLILTIWGFFFPEFWYSFFHKSEYIDPQGLLRRCAANWFAFFIIQFLAFLYWQKNNWWLLLVAGCRLGDTLTDITCLIFCSKITIFGLIAFPFAGLANLIIGISLILLYEKLCYTENQDLFIPPATNSGQRGL